MGVILLVLMHEKLSPRRGCAGAHLVAVKVIGVGLAGLNKCFGEGAGGDVAVNNV